MASLEQLSRMKLPNGKTIRQELTDMLSTSITRNAVEDRITHTQVRTLLEGLVEDGKPGTMGGLMKEYYLLISETTIRAIEQWALTKAQVKAVDGPIEPTQPATATEAPQTPQTSTEAHVDVPEYKYPRYEFIRSTDGETATCPFCGSKWANLYKKPHSNNDYMIFCIICMDCEGAGPWHYYPEGAIGRWNTRATPNQDGNLLYALDGFYDAKGLKRLTPVPKPPEPITRM